MNDSLLASKGSSNRSSEISVQSNLSEIENLNRESQKLSMSMSKSQRAYRQLCKRAKSLPRSKGNQRYLKIKDIRNFETPRKERKRSGQNFNDSGEEFNNPNVNRDSKFSHLEINETLKMEDLGICTGKEIFPKIKNKRDSRILDFDERQIGVWDFDVRHQGIQISSNSARRKPQNGKREIGSFQNEQRKSCNHAKVQEFGSHFKIKNEKGKHNTGNEGLVDVYPKIINNQHEELNQNQEHTESWNNMNRRERDGEADNLMNAQRETQKQWSSENQRIYRTGDTSKKEEIIILKTGLGTKNVQFSQAIGNENLKDQNQRNAMVGFKEQKSLLQPQHQHVQIVPQIRPRKRKNSENHVEISQNIEDESGKMQLTSLEQSSLEVFVRSLGTSLNLFMRIHNWLGSCAPLIYAGLILILVVVPF